MSHIEGKTGQIQPHILKYHVLQEIRDNQGCSAPGSEGFGVAIYGNNTHVKRMILWPRDGKNLNRILSRPAVDHFLALTHNEFEADNDKDSSFQDVEPSVLPQTSQCSPPQEPSQLHTSNSNAKNTTHHLKNHPNNHQTSPTSPRFPQPNPRIRREREMQSSKHPTLSILNLRLRQIRIPSRNNTSIIQGNIITDRYINNITSIIPSSNYSCTSTPESTMSRDVIWMAGSGLQ